MTMGVVSGFSIFFGIMVLTLGVLNSVFPHFDAFFSVLGIARYSRARPQEAVVLLPLEVGTLLF
jgi:hypothetical protein